jgi:hypothetical protein
MTLLWRVLLWWQQKQRYALMTPAEAWKTIARAKVIR